MSKDYYEILGVSRNATKSEIKKAFRAQAKQHHPDKGGEEKKIQEINEAYEVLSDDKKKSQYDQFGSVGGQGGVGGGGFSGGTQGFGGGFSGGFEDIFSDLFGGGGGRRGSSERHQRGSDLEVDLVLSFEDAVNGKAQEFSANIYQSCNDCEGKGGEGSDSCKQCHGRGRVRQEIQTPFGVMAQEAACPSCKGEGSTFKKVCSSCHGEGRTKKSTTIEVNIPQGVDDGETLKFRGKGEVAQRNKGSNGDLYVHISVRPSKQFRRSGYDLHSVAQVSVFDALLGVRCDIETFWGEVELDIPENTRDGQKFRINGKGIKRDGRTGDHIVTVEYVMPKKISSKMRTIIQDLKKEI